MKLLPAATPADARFALGGLRLVVPPILPVLIIDGEVGVP